VAIGSDSFSVNLQMGIAYAALSDNRQALTYLAKAKNCDQREASDDDKIELRKRTAIVCLSLAGSTRRRLDSQKLPLWVIETCMRNWGSCSPVAEAGHGRRPSQTGCGLESTDSDLLVWLGNELNATDRCAKQPWCLKKRSGSSTMPPARMAVSDIATCVSTGPSKLLIFFAGSQ